LPSKSSKTNEETQTALRGVSLMEMIQRSTTTGTVDDIENGKCRNGKCDVQVPSGANQVAMNILSFSSNRLFHFNYASISYFLNFISNL